MDRLPSDLKKSVSKIYSNTKKLVNLKSHVEFLEICVKDDLIPVGFELDVKRFDVDKEEMDKISKEIMILKISQMKRKEKAVDDEFKYYKRRLEIRLDQENLQKLWLRINKTMQTRRHSNKLKKTKKVKSFETGKTARKF